MSETMRARPAGIEKRPTGVRGLDELLGGDLTHDEPLIDMLRRVEEVGS